MIFDNYERQLPFLREAVEKLSNNFKKQRTYPEGAGCLPDLLVILLLASGL